MPIYNLHLTDKDNKAHIAHYNPSISSLTWEDNSPIEIPAKFSYFSKSKNPIHHKTVSIDRAEKAGIKKVNPNLIRIQLGLLCNYSCPYCSQKNLRKTETNSKDTLLEFFETLPTWYFGGKNGKGFTTTFEICGGEPFLYWKEMKEIVNAISENYPDASINITTNGSLFTPEIVEWIKTKKLIVIISHDGPLQHQRGKDILSDPIYKQVIVDLLDNEKGYKIVFSSLLSPRNSNIKDIKSWFFNTLNRKDIHLTIEGVVLPYSVDNYSNYTLDTPQEYEEFSNDIYEGIKEGHGRNFFSIYKKSLDFYYSLVYKRPSNALGQKCKMDKSTSLTVNLRGEVLSCQNTSSEDYGVDKASHKIGDVSYFPGIKLDTAKTWHSRSSCNSCPVLQLCQGGCMILDDEKFEKSCNNEYAYNYAIFRNIIEEITGMNLERIDGAPIRPFLYYG